jgi:hypothetical protein
LAASKSAPASRTSAPSARMRASLSAFAFSAANTVARAPRARAA